MSLRPVLLTGVLALLLGACAPVSKEKPRFLWIDAAANFRSYGNDADSIGRDCRRIAEMGFTDIVVDVRPTSGDVLFASSTAPALRKMPGWVGNGWGFRELQEKGIRGEVRGNGRSVNWSNETWVHVPDEE